MYFVLFSPHFNSNVIILKAGTSHTWCSWFLRSSYQIGVMAFYSHFCTVCYVSVLLVLWLWGIICIHICTQPKEKGVPQICYIWMYTFLALHFHHRQCMAFASLFVWGQIPKMWTHFIFIQTFSHFGKCVCRMLTLAKVSCSSCWYSESSSFLHSGACRYEESGYLSLGVTI